MLGKSLTIEQVFLLLTETPPRIAEITNSLTPAQLRTHPGPNEWTANDVLSHLRSCADVWGECIARIVAEDMPTIRAVNPRTWIKRTNYRDSDFRKSLDAYERQGTELLIFLRSLPVAAWARKATVTGAGNVLERTVLSYAQRLARHERPHVKQIEQIVAAMRF
jgi:hypothetical protein